MKVTFSGECRVLDKDGMDYPWPDRVVQCEIEADFAEYFSDFFVESGKASFRWEDGALFVDVEYTLRDNPTPEQLKALARYTQGQWSDGIGEGYQQHPQYVQPYDDEVYIKMWEPGQKIEITCIE